MTLTLPFEIKTSRYANGEAIVASGLGPVRISRGNPRFKVPFSTAGGKVIIELAPTAEEFKLHDQAIVREMQFARWDALGVDAIADRLVEQWEKAKTTNPEAAGVVLLCFERLDDDQDHAWCHRQHFADFWLSRTGQEVGEL